ncbi:MAG TPA: DNA primase [Patescibacteria group bacterium]|nr:DNA primase [Patescibacteria group bacterium]
MDSVEEIKARLNIENIIGEYVRLTPAGKNLKGLCPFHREKTSSFMVSPEKEMWHCFGCAKGGDLFSFVMEIEGIEFPEALRILAERAGVQLSRIPQPQKNKKTRVLDLLALLAQWYHQSFSLSQSGIIAREYAQKRGLAPETIQAWQIGYAPDLWDAGLVFAEKKGFTHDELRESGMFIVKSDGAMYDRFRHRLMFPIRDHRGMVVGFGGRILDGAKTDPGEAKYINSSQTLVYDKSMVLFGLYQARGAIREAGEAVIVEGYMDVVSSHQAEVKNVVAASGTALTSAQARILKRYTSTVSFAFDNDSAGLRAALRALDIAWAEAMTVKAIPIISGKDPDDCARESPEGWRNAVAGAVPVIDYWISVFQKTTDLLSGQGKRIFAQALLPLIRRLPDAIEQSHYIQRVSTLLHVPEETIIKTMNAPVKQQKNNFAHVSSPEDPMAKTVSQLPEEFLWGIVLIHPQLISVIVDVITDEMMPTDALKELYNSAKLYYNQPDFHHQPLEEFIRVQIPQMGNYPAVLQLLAEDAFGHLDAEHQLKEFEKLLIRIQRAWLVLQKKELIFQLKDAEQKGDHTQIEQLLIEQQRLHSHLQRLEKV